MAGEDGDPFAECWARTLLFLPWVQTLLQGVGSRGCSSVPVSTICPVSSARAASINTCPYNKKDLARNTSTHCVINRALFKSLARQA